MSETNKPWPESEGIDRRTVLRNALLDIEKACATSLGDPHFIKTTARYALELEEDMLAREQEDA